MQDKSPRRTLAEQWTYSTVLLTPGRQAQEPKPQLPRPQELYGPPAPAHLSRPRTRPRLDSTALRGEAILLGSFFLAIGAAWLVAGALLGYLSRVATSDTPLPLGDGIHLEKLLDDIQSAGAKLIHCRASRATMICDEVPEECSIARMSVEGGVIQANRNDNRLLAVAIETSAYDATRVRLAREQQLTRLREGLDACTSFEPDPSLQAVIDEAFRLRIQKCAGRSF